MGLHNQPGLEFRILCLEGSGVITFILPSSGGSHGPVWPICAQRWPKTPFIHSVRAIIKLNDFI